MHFNSDLSRGMVRLNIVTHNAWLIPGMGPWFLGRGKRVSQHVGKIARRLHAQDAGGEDVVTIAVGQEFFAFRVGVFWPLLQCLSWFEAALLRCDCVKGGQENFLYTVLKSCFILLVWLSTFIFQQWIPGLRDVVWDPKRHFVQILAKTSQLEWSADGVVTFKGTRSCRFPPSILDSGLVMSASRSADNAGFVPYTEMNSPELESIIMRGIVWARFGSMIVILTHMCFVNNDGGVARRQQESQLSAIVSNFLDPNQQPFKRVDTVVICGDFNLCLASQIDSGKTTKGENGVGGFLSAPGVGSPSVYRGAWLPEHANVDNLLASLSQNGMYSARRVSRNEPTCEDGTVDHVIVVTLSASAVTCNVVEAGYFEDAECHNSDHCALSVVMSIQRGQE